MLNVKAALGAYVPVKLVAQKQHAVFQTLLTQLRSPHVDSTISAEILDSIMSFAYGKEDLATLVGWLHTKEFELQRSQKQKIMLAVCKSDVYEGHAKQEIIDSIMANEKTDDILIEKKMTCRASMPDGQIKKEVWAQITAEPQGISAVQQEALLSGFYEWGQNDILEPYYAQYFSVLTDKSFYGAKSYKYLKEFVKGLLPRQGEVTQAEIATMQKVLDTIPQQDPNASQAYIKLLQEGVELLQRTKRLRDFAASRFEHK